MAEELLFGQMDPDMIAFGKTIKQINMGDVFIRMASVMKGQ